jgi:GrpB-like predicted nucleotidyltransferase (UPF0157 family)
MTVERVPRPGWDTGEWSERPPVRVVPYDPAWPERFEALRAAIAGALAGFQAQVEHVGSTAVPGLSARPGVDIMIGVPDATAIMPCVERLQSLGYQFHHHDQPDWAHLSGPQAKLHVTPIGSRFWTDHLDFRDELRAHPEAAGEYERLKLDLAREHGSNGARYVEGKTAFVESVLARRRRLKESGGGERSTLKGA